MFKQEEITDQKEFISHKTNSGKTFWILKEWKDGDFHYSIGETKKEAERTTTLPVLLEKPDWILKVGSYDPSNSESSELMGFDKLGQFFKDHMPPEIYDHWTVLPVFNKATNQLCAIFLDNHPELEAFYLVSSPGDLYTQARNILFQFLKLSIQDTLPNNEAKKNVKINQWVKRWFDRLPKGVP